MPKVSNAWVRVSLRHDFDARKAAHNTAMMQARTASNRATFQ